MRPPLVVVAGLLMLGGCGSDGEQSADDARPTTSVASERMQQPRAAGSGSVPATRASTGRAHAREARFSLRGSTLAITLGPTSDVRGFAGQKVRVECTSQLRPRPGRARTVRWPARTRRLVVRLGGDPGATPLFCSIDTASLRDRSYHADAILR